MTELAFEAWSAHEQSLQLAHPEVAEGLMEAHIGWVAAQLYRRAAERVAGLRPDLAREWSERAEVCQQEADAAYRQVDPLLAPRGERGAAKDTLPPPKVGKKTRHRDG